MDVLLEERNSLKRSSSVVNDTLAQARAQLAQLYDDGEMLKARAALGSS